MRKIKKFKYIIILIVFLAAIVFFAGKFDLSKIKKAWIGGPKTVNICYLKTEQEGGSSGQYNMRVEITGEKVKGNLNFLPANSISKTGTFEGTVTNFYPESNEREVALIWQADSAGFTRAEELRIVFNEEVASVGLGLMEEGSEGMYVYKNPENIAYTLSMLAAPCKEIKDK